MRSKLNIVLFAGAFVVTIASVIVINRVRTQSVAAREKQIFLTEGFDFRQQRALNKFLEVDLGSKINLADFQTTNGESLPKLIKGNLLLLAILDPDCSACARSHDMLSNIRTHANELGIKYLPMVLRKFPPQFDASEFANALGFDTCIQSSTNAPVGDPLAKFGTPSHVLVNKDGVILQAWQGTNPNAATRKRMADQISSDLYLISDTVNAMRSDSH